MKAFYHEIGTDFIRDGGGARIGQIKDDNLRAMAIDGLNCDCIDSQELEDAQEEIDELWDKIRGYEKEIATLKTKAVK